MLSFLRENIRWLGTGFLFTFVSAFGQTWFISLFAAEIKSEFALTDGSWGQLYTVATLSSALMMFLSGSLVDRVPLSRFAPLITVLFGLAALGMSLANSIFILGVSVFLLRYSGQGMFTHMSMTAMGRWFEATRGRAVSIANLGHPIGEVMLPILVVFAMSVIGWRESWLLVAGILVFVFAPVTWWLLGNNRSPHGKNAHELAPGIGSRHWTRREAVSHWLFPALIPLLLTPGLVVTVIFFHQIHIAESKGWSLLEMAAGYGFFATATTSAVFLTGWISDRFGSGRLLPFILLPMSVGIFLIGVDGPVWIWYLVLALCGLTQGASGAFWGVFLPVAYGTRYLGAIRSLATTIMVISTAIGPGITGMLIDAGIEFSAQGLWMSIWCLALSAVGVAIAYRLNAEA